MKKKKPGLRDLINFTKIMMNYGSRRKAVTSVFRWLQSHHIKVNSKVEIQPWIKKQSQP